MGGEWREVHLQDLASEITVGHVGSMASEYVSEGIPFLRSQNIEPFRVNLDDVKFITSEFHAKLKKSALKPGDVCIVRTGKPGACAVIPESLADSNCSDLVIIRCGEALDNRFLMYYINSVASHHVNAHLVGAVQQHFNVGSARQLKIRLPPLETQRAIAHILGTLDDKIELNRRTNQTLEAIAKALFKSWFVDFDPVRAKAEGRQPEGMDAQTAALFPDGFEDSELGMVPRGWKVVPFADAVEVIGGGTPKTTNPDYWDGDIPWFSVVDAPSEGDIWVIDTEKKITQKGLEESSTRLLPIGTTIVSARGTVGKLALVGREMAMNQSCYGLHPKHPLGALYIYFATRNLVTTLQKNTHGSVFDTITRATLQSVSVIIPTGPVAKAFEKAVGQLLERIRANLEESRTLAALRDTLLPKLLSGELSLTDTDRLVSLHL